MAERGAHLTSTEQEKPSIFEVVASDSLHATFYPAIRRLCTVLANANPDRFGWTVRHYDELFLALNATVQQYYVRRFDASLSEVFYGLTHHRTASSTTTTDATALPHLTTKSRLLLFGAIVLVPYLRQKLDTLLQRYREDLNNPNTTATAATHNPPPNNTFAASPQQRLQLKQLAVRVGSTCIGVYECLQVLQYIAYMANKSPAHSLQLRCLRQQLAYLDDDSTAQLQLTVSNWSWSDLWTTSRSQPAAFLTAIVFRGLELSAFFLQFVRWWTEEASQPDLMRLPVPPAPAYDANSGKYMGICPLCVQSWDIPTAVSISGYVYCYKCIVRHMDGGERTCPVSGYAADVDDLIRVFDV